MLLRPDESWDAPTFPVYFSDVFEVEAQMVDDYGAFNIALINDLPLFVDPFLLFDSTGDKYKPLHDGIIDYLVFIKEQALDGELSPGDVNQWLLFKEVKQNWLGFSQTGNEGTGLGPAFARSLATNLRTVFRGFGGETTTSSSHLEKLGLLTNGVGRDHLSDFTTNLIKGYLLAYTQEFAKVHLNPKFVKTFRVDKVEFNYATRRWKSGYFELPYFDGDYVLLTPKDMLTREEAWINQGDMLAQFTQIQVAIPDNDLRQRVDQHFVRQVNERSSARERREAALRTLAAHPEVLDIYIRMKEESAPEAHAQSGHKVEVTETQFVENVRQLAKEIAKLRKQMQPHPGDLSDNALEEARRRVAFLKHVIENNDGYRFFYVNGEPVKRESDLQTMFKLTWCATSFDVNAEVNNGRGPVDYKVSKGKANAALVEFKLASNTGLEKNLRNQVAIYERASNTKRSLKVILCFNEVEHEKVNRILRTLAAVDNPDIIRIDASRANKTPASKT